MRLTDDPAWDEQAIFTPDMKRIIFMSTRDNPGAFNDYAMVAQLLGLPADYDYAPDPAGLRARLPAAGLRAGQRPLRLPASRYTDGEVSGAGAVRRLTTSGEQGWVKPEFAFDDAGKRLLWTAGADPRGRADRPAARR